jgi:hypothetical protein
VMLTDEVVVCCGIKELRSKRFVKLLNRLSIWLKTPLLSSCAAVDWRGEISIASDSGANITSAVNVKTSERTSKANRRMS